MWTFWNAVDPRHDPVLRVYQAAFPHRFLAAPRRCRPGWSLTCAILRICSRSKAQKYATYHMTEPHVFYNSEDLGRTRARKRATARLRWSPTMC